MEDEPKGEVDSQREERIEGLIQRFIDFQQRRDWSGPEEMLEEITDISDEAKTLGLSEDA